MNQCKKSTVTSCAYFSVLKNDNAITVNDRIQPMSYCKYGALFEDLPQCGLDDDIRLRIDGRRRLIQKKDLKSFIVESFPNLNYRIYLKTLL